MKCPVCDKVNTSMLCPECGFDSSRDYGKYPTFGSLWVQSASGMRKAWKQKENVAGVNLSPQGQEKHDTSIHEKERRMDDTALTKEKRKTFVEEELYTRVEKKTRRMDDTIPVKKKQKPLFLSVAMLVWMLILGILIGTVLSGMKTETAYPWETNILHRFENPSEYGDREIGEEGYLPDSDTIGYPVFGSEYERYEICSVTFLDTLENAPKDAWDVSEAKNGAVMAWVEVTGEINEVYECEMYDLYIAGDGGVWAGNSCKLLFAGYTNVEHITFGDVFHTENVQDMSHMFKDCTSLTNLDLSNFDTSNVWDMSSMFSRCVKLSEVNLNQFDTSNVKDMCCMFFACRNLSVLDLRSFDTVGVKDMSEMFAHCESLTGLTTSDLFVTENANVEDMYGDSMIWDTNVLKADDHVSEYVYGTHILKENVKTVAFIDSLEDIPSSAVDVSENSDGSVMMWWSVNGENAFDLYFAANGGVNGREASYRMFNYYRNLESVDFGECFHTEETTDMSFMFISCYALKTLDLSGLDLKSVETMSHMFYDCRSLTELDFGSYDASNLKVAKDMFYKCPAGEDYQHIGQ